MPQQCPTEKPINQTDCAIAGEEGTLGTNVLPRNQPGDHQASAEQSDAAGSLLEELVKVVEH